MLLQKIHIQKMEDISDQALSEIKHFFEQYTILENKKVEVKEYGNQPSKTSLADPIGSRNTIKTLKLHNHKVSV